MKITAKFLKMETLYKQHSHKEQLTNSDTEKKQNIKQKKNTEKQKNEDRPALIINDAHSCKICNNCKAHK